MASGDLLNFFLPQQNSAPAWLYVAFTSGSTEPSLGDTIWGDTSNANAVLEYITLTSGTWGGGDAAGYMLLSNHNGTAWTSGENFTANSAAAANHGTLTSLPVTAAAPPAVVRSDSLVLAFDATLNEVALFPFVMPRHYGGRGVNLTIGVSSTTATGDMSWATFFKSFTPDAAGDNFSAVGTDPSALKVFAAPQFKTDFNAASVAGEIASGVIAHTEGAQMDSILIGEYGNLLLMRDAQDGTNDDMAADAEFVFLEMREA